MAKFKPGSSPNPRGRPKGAIGPSTKLRQAIAADLPEVIAVVRQQALAGDVGAARLLLERALPALRPEAATVTLPAKASLSARTEAVVGAALAGEMPASTAAAFIDVLAGSARIAEFTELEGRIAALEGKHERHT